MQWRLQTEVCTFVQAAQQFCQVVDAPAGEPEIWAKKVLQTLLPLCSAGLALSSFEIEVSDSKKMPAAPFTTKQWQQLFGRLSMFLGERKYYSQLDFESWRKPDQQEAFVGDLADDLADIYGDILPGIQQWNSEAEEYLGDIVWDWQFGFTHHWGDHAIAAIGYLHYLTFSPPLLRGNANS